MFYIFSLTHFSTAFPKPNLSLVANIVDTYTCHDIWYQKSYYLHFLKLYRQCWFLWAPRKEFVGSCGRRKRLYCKNILCFFSNQQKKPIGISSEKFLPPFHIIETSFFQWYETVDLFFQYRLSTWKIYSSEI